ncbi:MAG: Nif3-like dinuclear metal center hexameric protein [Alistipes sp.]|nr:Nif3-like dinuclear metal center hexameric protein [Alistipes sp.]
MKIKEIIAPLEEFAPLGLQEAYDNCGLVVGELEDEANAALVCVDVTEEVLDEAIAKGAGLVIAHHPIIFHPLRAIGSRGNVERVVAKAIRNNIAIYAAHTNLDRARHGMSYVLARQLGLLDIEVLDPEVDGSSDAKSGVGFGAVGDLPEAMGVTDFLRKVAARLGIGCVRHSALCGEGEKVRRVALMTGAGGEGLERAIEVGADLFLSADLKHDRFLAATGRIVIADIGHFESEFCAIELIFDVISKKIANFALHKSVCSHNPVNYLV